MESRSFSLTPFHLKPSPYSPSFLLVLDLAGFQVLFMAHKVVVNLRNLCKTVLREVKWGEGILKREIAVLGFPGGASGEESVFLPGKFHGERSQVSYSPWGRKESDTTELLNMHYFIYIYMYTHTHTHIYIYTHTYIWASLVAQLVKNLPTRRPQLGSWVGKTPLEKG